MNDVYFCESFPVALIQSNLVVPKDALEILVQDVRKNGIEKPLILELRDEKFIVLLGSKRVAAAKILGISTVKAIINANKRESINLINCEKLTDKEQVIAAFGGVENVDLEHLCVDEKGRLLCVGSDHKKWVTCELGGNPVAWCKSI